MLKMNILLNISFILILSLNVFGQTFSPENTFNEAINAYDSTNYRQADELFKTLLEQGYDSKEIYYNAGNTAFQLHDYARAILYYEKAKKVASPLSEKINNNIQLAQERITDKPEKTRAGFFNWISSFVGYTFDFWAILGVLSLLFFVIARVVKPLITNMFLYKLANAKAFIFLSLFLVFTGLASIKYYISKNSFSGIVMVTASTIKSSADYSSESIRVLHAGSKVVLLGEKDGWINIRFGSSEGWIKQEDISEI